MVPLGEALGYMYGGFLKYAVCALLASTAEAADRHELAREIWLKCIGDDIDLRKRAICVTSRYLDENNRDLIYYGLSGDVEEMRREVSLLLDTNVLLFECRSGLRQHPTVKVDKRAATMLAIERALRIGVCILFQGIVGKICGSQACLVSEFSRVEFLRAVVSNVVAREAYRAWLGRQRFQAVVDLVSNEFTNLINQLKEVYKIDVVDVDGRDVERAVELAGRWSRDREVVKRHAFDLLLLAQAVNRGARLFTTDRGIFNIRERALDPRPTSQTRASGVKVYEDEYILYVSYSS